MFNYTQADPSLCQFVDIAPLEELPTGERLFVEIEDKKIVIFNMGGKLFAIGDVCSHDSGPVGDGDIEGTDIVCPRHGAHFDIPTGKALQLPAVEDIPAYPVRVVNGRIEIGLP